MKRMAAHTGPNMTPMVDVVMCILIFFMLGSSLAIPDLYLTSNMPAVDKGGLSDSKGSLEMPKVQFTIKLDAVGTETNVDIPGEGQLNLPSSIDPSVADKRDLAEKSLAAILVAKKQTLSADVQVIISPSAGAPYQDVITAYDDCIRAGFQHVAFAATR